MKPGKILLLFTCILLLFATCSENFVVQEPNQVNRIKTLKSGEEENYINLFDFYFGGEHIFYIDDTEKWNLDFFSSYLSNPYDSDVDGVVQGIYDGTNLLIDIKVFKETGGEPIIFDSFKNINYVVENDIEYVVWQISGLENIEPDDFLGSYKCEIYPLGDPTNLLAESSFEIAEEFINTQVYEAQIIYPENHSIVNTTKPVLTWAKYEGQLEGSPCTSEFISLGGPGSGNPYDGDLGAIYQSKNDFFWGSYLTEFSVEFWDEETCVDFMTPPSELAVGRYVAGLTEYNHYLNESNMQIGQFVQVRYIEFFVNPSIPVVVSCSPNVLNSKSKGKWITVFIQVPEDQIGQVDLSSISIMFNNLLFPIEKTNIKDDEIIVKCNRAAAIQVLNIGANEIIASGNLTDGTEFTGSGNIILK